MVDFSWDPTTPLSRTLVAGRYGRVQGAAGVSLTELRDFDLVQIMVRRGQREAASQGATRHFGAPPPDRPQAVRAGASTLIWSGPDQFLALAARGGAASMLDSAQQSLAGVASLSDQSDGRALIRVSGPQARALLAKLVSVDLHPKAFPRGAAAATALDHTGVNLWRGDDADDGGAVFFMLILSSFAESLWGSLLDAGAEYAVEAGTAGVSEATGRTPDLKSEP